MLQTLDSDTVVVYTDGSYFYQENGYGAAACVFSENSLYNVQHLIPPSFKNSGSIVGPTT